eukprot:COSAG01_NODE_40450_length_463_cov_1.472527_1_plen_76_part_10
MSQNGWLLSRRGRSLPANASGLDTHRDSIISGRFDVRCAELEETVAAMQQSEERARVEWGQRLSAREAELAQQHQQ